MLILIYDPGGMEGWVDLGGWLHTEINVRHRELNPDTVIHLSTNWARRRLEVNKIAFQSKAVHPRTVYTDTFFCSRDTRRLWYTNLTGYSEDVRAYISNMNLLRQGFEQLEHYRQTDIHSQMRMKTLPRAILLVLVMYSYKGRYSSFR